MGLRLSSRVGLSLSAIAASLWACGGPTARSVPDPTASAATASAAPPAASAPAPVDFVLRPVCGADGEPTALDVQVSLDAWSAEPPSFRVADPESAPQPMGDLVSRASLSDARGELPLQTANRPDPVDHERRFFVEGARPASGSVTLRYRVRAVPTSEKGPRFGLRNDTNGIGGTANGFLLVPAIDASRTLRVRWETAGCSPDLRPTSALGHGTTPPALVAPPDALRPAGFFFARAETIDVDERDLRFSFTFVGRPAFDTRVAARYAADVLRAERAAFGDEDPTPFYALMRVLPEMTKFVTGSGNAYGYTSVVGPEAPWNTRMRDHIAHELLHHWVGVGLWIRDEAHVNGYWLTEGFTVHYSRVIPLRLGLLPPDEFLAQLRELSTTYRSSPHRGASNRAIEDQIDRGIGERPLGLMPYYRGALYAAELDMAIREASNGARSLDDLMRDLFRLAETAPRNEAGYRELPESAVRHRIFTELGQAGVERFDAVIRRGDLADPPGSAYGPCFDKREPKPGEIEWYRVDGVPDSRCGELPRAESRGAGRSLPR